MTSNSDPCIDDLLRWCSARGIQIDARIRVARGEDGSICVVSQDGFIEPRTTCTLRTTSLSRLYCEMNFAICKLTADKLIPFCLPTVVSIPKSTVLSVKTCALAEHVPQVTYGRDAQLGLALALYGEL